MNFHYPLPPRIRLDSFNKKNSFIMVGLISSILAIGKQQHNFREPVKWVLFHSSFVKIPRTKNMAIKNGNHGSQGHASYRMTVICSQGTPKHNMPTGQPLSFGLCSQIALGNSYFNYILCFSTQDILFLSSG